LDFEDEQKLSVTKVENDHLADWMAFAKNGTSATDLSEKFEA
jgi:hypothetical protein